MSDALAPVAEMLALQFFLGCSPAQLTPQQASSCKKAALLAIGDHIKRGMPEWSCIAADDVWEYVARSTRHRMGGQQLRALYGALAEQHEKAQDADHPVPGEQARALREQDEQVAACVASASAAMQSHQAQGTPFAGCTICFEDTGELDNRFAPIYPAGS
jgi:hypothetical protein